MPNPEEPDEPITGTINDDFTSIFWSDGSVMVRSDIDECADENSNDCDQHEGTECFNLAGSYVCNCLIADTEVMTYTCI